MKRRIATMACVVLLVTATACGDSDPVAEDAGASSTAVPETTTTALPPTTTTTVATTTTTAAPTTTTEPVAWPGTRGYHDMVYDAGSDAVLVFGGCVGASCTPRRDGWRLDPATLTWVDLGALPQLQTSGIAAAYDAGSDRVVYLETAFDYDLDAVSTWVYDTDAAEWTDMAPDPQPKLGVGTRLVYDSESDRLIAFGGFAVDSSGLLATPGTWAYDLEANIWEEMAPAEEPQRINYHAMAYDAESDRVVVFGLNDPPESQLWAYDYNSDSWEELTLEGGPEGAFTYTQAVYAPTADRILVFGGLQEEETEIAGGTMSALVAHNQLWAYDYNTNSWEMAAANELSGPIAFHGIAWIASTGTLAVFGGGPGEGEEDYAGDGLWLYDAATGVWAEG